MILQNVKFVITTYIVLWAMRMLICILSTKLLVHYSTTDCKSLSCQDVRLELLLRDQGHIQTEESVDTFISVLDVRLHVRVCMHLCSTCVHGWEILRITILLQVLSH